MKLKKLFNSRNNKGKNKINNGKEFKIDGYTTTDIIDFINDVGIEDKELEDEVYIFLGVAALTIIMLVQLRYSCTEAPSIL